jgi:hypothetical protein
VRHLPGRLLGVQPGFELRQVAFEKELFDMVVLDLGDGTVLGEAVQKSLDRTGGFLMGPG